MAYSAVVSLTDVRARRISHGLGIIGGTCDIASYNTTPVAFTGITKYFKSVYHVIGGASDNGHVFQWNSNYFECYKPTFLDVTSKGSAVGTTLGLTNGVMYGSTAGGTTDDYKGAATEAANGDDCGKVQFLAIGEI